MGLCVNSVEVGAVESRCYLLIDEQTGLAAVVDCGAFTDEVRKMLAESNIRKLEYIFLTHGHFDHILGVKKLQKEFGGEIIVHEEDAPMLSSPALSLARAFRMKNEDCFNADKTIVDGDSFELGGTNIKVLHTPGHTKGSVCYVSNDTIFSGDTLFRLSIGRTDFRGGSMKDILESITKIALLPGDYVLYPGHGESSTLEAERQENGYLRNRI